MASILFVIFRISKELIQMQLSKKLNNFCHFFFLYFWNLHHILNILKKKVNLIAYAFPKLQIVKGIVRQMFK